MAAELRFRAMGTDVHLVAVSARDLALERARRAVDRLEHLWSRFLPDSEVSLVNAGDGEPVSVSSETVTLFQHAIEGWRATEGLYDPTVIAAVVAAGYDRSFEHVEPTGPWVSPYANHAPGCEDFVVDERAMTVTASPGVGFDPGGIGKGLAADLIATKILENGDARGICVNIGGDVRVAGEGPLGAPWVIALDDPFGGSPVARVALHEGAIATSSRARRRWTRGNEELHHLIDPRTGRPSQTEVVAATVIAGEAWWAEVLAKIAFLLPREESARVLEGFGVPALIIEAHGERYGLAGMEECLT